jgi:glycosyltransferase involved in cell wall biosynthesis
MISVVIPTYKSPEALDLCLRSIISGQKNNNEILVVVDGFFDTNKTILEKYSNNIRILNLLHNVGTCKASNIGVYHTSHEKVLLANDDNVFPNDWDVLLENDYEPNSIISVNQIEPFPSIFRQIHIKNLGRDPSSFDLENFWKYSESISSQKKEFTGSTFPILFSKFDCLRVGGFDENYPSQSGAVSDWDFFLKCSLSNISLIRTYSCHFYHFVSLSRKLPEQAEKQAKEEQLCHEYARMKWGRYIQHNPINNQKYI